MTDAPPAPRPRRGPWIAGAAALVALAGGVAVAVAWPAETPSSATVPTASPAPPLVTATPDAPDPASSTVTEQAATLLGAQGEGLVAGDFTRFAAAAAPGDKTAAAALRRRFDNLRALQVTRFDQRLDGPARPVKGKKGHWRVVTAVHMCYVQPHCAEDVTMLDSLWTETPQGLRFANFATHDSNTDCTLCLRNAPIIVRPWEVTDLAVRAGKRTLVAVPVRHRGRLADLTRRAEAAAALADTYTAGDTPVDRYRLFVAGDKEWKRWYTGNPGRWVAGRALPVGPNGVEVEVLLDELTPHYADELLRHELAHVATLRSDAFYGNNDVWWLVEGMADYVQQRAGAGRYFKRDTLRGFLDDHKLASVKIPPPADGASDEDAAARYAVGYYAVSHLMKAYGKEKTLRFFAEAVQSGFGLESASLTAFGKPWARIDKECAAAVRKA